MSSQEPPIEAYDYNVFINCPFDEAYRPLFYAIVFAVHDCGFIAHCTLEIDDAGRVRIESIYELIAGCRFGIHDVSRTELDEINQLPRFNMPLELGLFLGASRFGADYHQDKSVLILDREPYRYQKFISDISGQDIKSHEGIAEHAIRTVRDWLDNSPVDPSVIRPARRSTNATSSSARSCLRSARSYIYNQRNSPSTISRPCWSSGYATMNGRQQRRVM